MYILFVEESHMYTIRDKCNLFLAQLSYSISWVHMMTYITWPSDLKLSRKIPETITFSSPIMNIEQMTW